MMADHSNDPVDVAIDKAARQIAAQEAPAHFAREVLWQLRGERRHADVVWRLAMAGLLIGDLTVSVIWQTSHRHAEMRTSAESSQRPAATSIRPAEPASAPAGIDRAGESAAVPDVSRTDLSVAVQPLIPITIADIEPNTIAIDSVDVRPIELASLSVGPVTQQP